MENEKLAGSTEQVRLKRYEGADGMDMFWSRIGEITDRKRKGIVIVFTDEDVTDFANNVTTVEVRDAVLSYARDLATYEGD